ncbi:MAG: PDZ domain-containing protein [Alphaproteobacteria bacterium]|nr:PDZ domain-containing protein [Alphaproteobacteria bacterium]
MAKSFYEKIGFPLSLICLFMVVITVIPSRASARHDLIPSIAEERAKISAFENVMFTAYSYISQRYIDPITVRQLAYGSLKAVLIMDSNLGLDVKQNKITLSYKGNRVKRIGTPAADDAAGWAKVVGMVVRIGRRKSKRLASFRVNDLYEPLLYYSMEPMDTFTRYTGYEQAVDNRSARNGFGGVGIRFRTSYNHIEITDIISHTPAASSSLQIGDKVVSIGDVELAGLSSRKISDLLRGTIGSEIQLSVLKEAKKSPIFVSLERTLIIPPTVEYSLADEILTIHAYGFNQRTASSIEGLINKFRTEKTKGVVLDLRGNPGGLLDQAISIADLFLESGTIVTTKGRHPRSYQFYSATKGDILNGLPLVVLIDGTSASSAEIVAAALEDNGRAAVIGSVSYGKGTVQTVTRLPNNGELAVTWSRFHTPSGYTLNSLGVLPAVCTSYANANPEALKDYKTAEMAAVQLIDSVRSGNNSIAADMEAWRNANVEIAGEADSLRNSCPPVASHSSKFDLIVARELLSDHNTYRKMLSFSAPVSAQR